MNKEMKAILKSNPIISRVITINNRYKKENWNPKFDMGKLKYFAYTYSKSFVYTDKDKSVQLRKLFQNIDIRLDVNSRFYYYIDFYKKSAFNYRTLNNITVDYELILNHSLKSLKIKCENSSNPNRLFIDSADILIEFAKKTKCMVEGSNNPRKLIIAEYFDNLIEKECTGFEEALQRILFLNQIMWQIGHDLNGIGRLDKLLIPYYLKDVSANKLTKESAKEILMDFWNTLHKGFYFKSGSLPGDTGQIIILGGKNADGTVIDNELTHLFIDVAKEVQLPDPKLLLRVSSDMDYKLMREAVECIATGIGCPLLSNDEVVIPKLLEFGIDVEDAYNYMTSACWEPLIAGKSFDQNNQSCLNFMIPFQSMLDRIDLDNIDSVEEMLQNYYRYLDIYLGDLAKELIDMEFEESPIMSLFVSDCIESGKDIANGGAKYNNFGITSVGLANVTDSVINISKIVFDEKRYTLSELNNIRKKNYEGYDEIRQELRNNIVAYGHDEESVIKIVNNILNAAEKSLHKYSTRYGGKIKFGCSSPSYISASQNIGASLDGRKAGEPFRVHISGKGNLAYTELISFASQIDYSGLKFNGNVIDYFVTPNFIEDNIDKFTDFLILSIEQGFFQMQMNVVSSKKLIEARKDPEKFPDLIVRVWGFSAYFNELPDSYKDYLIKRAIESERM